MSYRQLPSLSALRAFEAAARHESAKQAAAELSVTATAISHQIKGLEAALGTALFLRRPRQLELTPQGRELQQVLESAFDSISSAVERVSAAPARQAVTLSTTPAIAVRWLLSWVCMLRETHPNIDVLIVVGGIHTEEVKKPAVISWISNVASTSKRVASVCTGAFILAEANLLNGLTVTTHWEDIADLSATYPKLNVVSDHRWVSQGKYITSGGISAGIDMSLHLVSELSTLNLAEQTAKQMEYHWQKCT